MSEVAGRPGIDTHLHLWDRAVSAYAWITPAHGRLFDTFGPQRARAALDRADIDAAILVQAEDSRTDTDYLLRTAAATDWVVGVVGWLQLDSPAVAREQLAAGAEDPWLVGVRHLVQDDPRAGFLDFPAVLASLRLVAEAGLVLDIPDAWRDTSTKPSGSPPPYRS